MRTWPDRSGIKNRIVFLIVLTGLAAIYISGCRRAGHWLAKEDVPNRSDALVILMGNFPERVLEATDLYNDEKAEKILIVFESMGPYKVLESRGAEVIRTTQQAHDAAVAIGVPSGKIIMLPGDARSTLDEALAVRKYVETNPSTDTILLVSSPAHMRRAGMIFNAALKNLPADVYIGCSPSSYSGFNPEKWWRRKEDIQAVVSELVKITSFQLFEKRQLKKRIKDK